MPQLTEHALNFMIENAQTDPLCAFMLNLVCRAAIRRAKKVNPLPLPAKISSFDVNDEESHSMWLEWSKHTLKQEP